MRRLRQEFYALGRSEAPPLLCPSSRFPELPSAEMHSQGQERLPSEGSPGWAYALLPPHRHAEAGSLEEEACQGRPSISSSCPHKQLCHDVAAMKVATTYRLRVGVDKMTHFFLSFFFFFLFQRHLVLWGLIWLCSCVSFLGDLLLVIWVGCYCLIYYFCIVYPWGRFAYAWCLLSWYSDVPYPGRRRRRWTTVQNGRSLIFLGRVLYFIPILGVFLSNFGLLVCLFGMFVGATVSIFFV